MRHRAGQYPIQRRAKPIDVRPMIQRHVHRLSLLRTQITQRPLDRSDHRLIDPSCSSCHRNKKHRGCFVKLRCILDRFAHPPIHHHRLAISIDHDVLRLDVTVDHLALIIRILQRIACSDQMPKQRSDLIDHRIAAKRLITDRLDPFGQLIAPYQLHREKWIPLIVLT